MGKVERKKERKKKIHQSANWNLFTIRHESSEERRSKIWGGIYSLHIYAGSNNSHLDPYDCIADKKRKKKLSQRNAGIGGMIG